MIRPYKLNHTTSDSEGECVLILRWSTYMSPKNVPRRNAPNVLSRGNHFANSSAGIEPVLFSTTEESMRAAVEARGSKQRVWLDVRGSTRGCLVDFKGPGTKAVPSYIPHISCQPKVPPKAGVSVPTNLKGQLERRAQRSDGSRSEVVWEMKHD